MKNPIFRLNSTKMLMQARIRQIGFSANVRNMRNLGISFDDAYVMLFGKEATK